MGVIRGCPECSTCNEVERSNSESSHAYREVVDTGDYGELGFYGVGQATDAYYLLIDGAVVMTPDLDDVGGLETSEKVTKVMLEAASKQK